MIFATFSYVMKRKLINILLSILILFSNSGWAITFHYCKDTLSSISLEYLTQVTNTQTDDCSTTNKCCAGDNNQETSHKKCCDDTSVSSSIQDSTTLVKSLELQLQPFVVATPTLPSLVVVQPTTKPIQNLILPDLGYRLNPPPLDVLHCQRVFYC